MASGHGDVYHPKDAIKATVNGSLFTGGVGLFAAAVRNSLAKQNVGAWAVFTRGGPTIVTFAAAGGAYEFSRAASANLREADDFYNSAIAGFVGGAIAGLRGGKISHTLGLGVLAAVALGAADYTGGIRSRKETQGDEEYERKEALRRNRRRPIEETVEELGEIRGIQAPGYEERRRQRLKEKYGVEINPVSVNSNA